MKTKRKSVILSIALSLLLVLSALFIAPFKSAKAEIAVDGVSTGGTAYEPTPKTIENEGTISYTTDWNVTGGDLDADQRGPFSGAVLTANPGSSTFNLGTYDFSTADASKALIKFLPWSVHTATNGTDPYNNFLITFSSGEKSFEVKSYTRGNGEAGLGVKGESQSKYIGLNPVNGNFEATRHGGDTVVSYIMLGLDGSYGGVRAYGTETSLSAFRQQQEKTSCSRNLY